MVVLLFLSRWGVSRLTLAERRTDPSGIDTRAEIFPISRRARAVAVPRRHGDPGGGLDRSSRGFVVSTSISKKSRQGRGTA